MSARLLRLLFLCLFAFCSSWQLLQPARKCALPCSLAIRRSLVASPCATGLFAFRAITPLASRLQGSSRSGELEDKRGTERPQPGLDESGSSSGAKSARAAASKAATRAVRGGRRGVAAAQERSSAAAAGASGTAESSASSSLQEASNRAEQEKVGFGHRSIKRRAPSHHFNPLTNRRPAKLIYRPPERFARQFLCVAAINDGRYAKRRESWNAHLRWLRRPALLAKVPPVPEPSDLKSARVEVVHAYTVLSEDRLSPAGQLVVLRANDVQSALDYVELEPLASAGVVTWKVWELELDGREELANDLYSPFVFVAPPVETQAAAAAAAATEAAGGGLAPERLADWLSNSSDLFNNATRVCLHGVLRPLDDNERGGARGAVTVFNAHSQRDALRYLQLSATDDRVRAVNVLDVDGLHHWMPRTAAEAQQLLQWHFEDPLDLWKENLSVEDALFLLHVRQANKSFKYRRDAGPTADAHAHADWWSQEVRDGALLSAPDLPAEEYDEIDSDMLLGYDAEEEFS